MAREDLTGRAARVLAQVERPLRASPWKRWAAGGFGLLVAVALHASTKDPGWAWLGAVPAVLGGVTGGAVYGLAAAATAGVAHGAVDLAQDGLPVVGVLVRAVGFAGLGLVGAVIARVEQQRDLAMLRSATEDPVTGLLNVRAFYDGLGRLRREGADFAVLLANVAGMGELNERYGHPMGTEALCALGHALRRSVKSGDLVARLGSDEVAIALVGADRLGAVAAARRLADLLAEEELHLPDGTRLDVHAYFGIATFPTDAADEVDLLRAAEHAMTEAKRAGPDEVAFTPA
ncbi:MAG TPA: GGDEF domain-containing protein [Nitriliruptorales bacterium]